MTRLFFALAILTTLSCLSPAGAGCRPPADRLAYSVSWGGAPVGSYEVGFEQNSVRVVVRTDIDVTAKLLFITVMRFIHESEAIWIDGRLQSYRGHTFDNGAETAVSVEPHGDGLALTRNGDSVREMPVTVLPSSLWCREMLRDGPALLLDLLKGRLWAVEVRHAGEEDIQVGDRRVRTRHYAITGEYERDIWYDAEGIAVQARFPAHIGPSVYLRLE